METDQFTVLALSLQAVCAGVGAHVLVLPALRYVFVAAAWCLRFRADEAKPVRGDNRRGRLVCAAVVVALLVAILPDVSLFAANVVMALAGVLLAWSFAADVGHLLRHVRRAECAE
jgi:hypothetical protein